MKVQTLSERRRLLGRLVMDTVNKPGPLSSEERKKLKRLQVEMEELEGDIAIDTERRASEAFNLWLRDGAMKTPFSEGISGEMRALLRPANFNLTTQFRDMGAGNEAAYSGATSGFFVPMDFYDRVESAMKDYSGLFDVARIIPTTTGRPLPFPSDNDTSNSGELIAENSLVTTGTDVANLGQVVLGGYKFSSKLVRVSRELLSDTGFDLSQYLAERFGVRIGRVLNTYLTTGTGSSQPTGIVTQATQGAVALGSSTNDGVGLANSIGSNDVAALEGSVDPSYRGANATFMMNPQTKAALQKVLDKNGRPIFFRNGMELNGFKVTFNPSMDVLQTGPSSPQLNRKTILFGDFSRYVVRRGPAMVLRLEEKYAEYGQLAFLMISRFDANLIDGSGGAVKYLANVY